MTKLAPDLTQGELHPHFQSHSSWREQLDESTSPISEAHPEKTSPQGMKQLKIAFAREH